VISPVDVIGELETPNTFAAAVSSARPTDVTDPAASSS
jgi:hypothetical protein